MGNTAATTTLESLHDDEDNKNDNDNNNKDDKSYYPEFSWDHLPLYIHVRKLKRYTPPELQYLSTFPLITLEKTTGMRTYQYTDIGTLKTAAQIKQYNPSTKILFYWNSLIHYVPLYSFDDELDGYDEETGEEKGCYLKDKDTKEDVKILSGGFKLYDLSLRRVRDWWISKATNVVVSPEKKKKTNDDDDDDSSSSNLDGVFMDAIVKVLDRNYLTQVANISMDKKKQVVKGWNSMASSLQQAFHPTPPADQQQQQPSKLILANLIRADLPNGGLDSLHYFDGSYIEHFESAALHPSKDVVSHVEKSIELVQQAARNGAIIALTLDLADGFDEDEYDTICNHSDSEEEMFKKLQPRIDYCIGLYLIIAEKYSYVCIHDGYDINEHRYDNEGGTKGEMKCKSIMWLKRLKEYDYKVGKPCGAAVKEGYVYKREFEHVKVEVDIESRTACLDWSDDWVMVSKE